jgi:hypothetical protein
LATVNDLADFSSIQSTSATIRFFQRNFLGIVEGILPFAQECPIDVLVLLLGQRLSDKGSIFEEIGPSINSFTQLVLR